MRNFDYTKAAIKCIDNEIVNMLIEIYKRNERLNFVFGSGKYDFSDFARQAQLESVISSNRMEYAHFNENSVERILQDKNPVLSQEIEICGYNDALEDIFNAKRPYDGREVGLINEHFKKYDRKDKYFEIRTSNHNVYKYSKDDKVILDFDPIEFDEISDYLNFEAPTLDEMWCGEADFLLILPIFIVDLMKVYPYRNHTEQICRLMMNAMLWGKNFQIVKHSSLERIIEETADEYHQAIAESLKYWEDELNDYKPIVKYILKVIIKAFKDFEKKTEYILLDPLSKTERVEHFTSESGREVTKSDIRYYCPDISETTVEIALRELKNAGIIEKIGGGRYTKYRYKRP